MSPTLSDLELRYDGPIPQQHLLPEDHRERMLRGAIQVNTSLADQFDRSAEIATDPDYRQSCERNAKWHRDEVVRLEREIATLNPIPHAAE